jgi:hypothetical protein
LEEVEPTAGDDKGTEAVKLPATLVARVSRRLAKSEFKTVDEYIGFVLDQVLTEVEGREGQEAKSTEAVFSKEDQASVEQRLRDLGYM